MEADYLLIYSLSIACPYICAIKTADNIDSYMIKHKSSLR